MPEFIIAGGDTNTVFSLIDKEGGSSALKHKAIHAFEDFKTRYDLIDTFRVKSPLSRNYSWETFNPTIIRERIDIIFASNTLLDHISEVGIIPTHLTCSDHGVAYLKIVGKGVPSRGPGIWKFNNMLLGEASFKSEMEKLIPTWINEAEKDLPNERGSQWAYLKFKMGEFCRNFGAKIKKAKQILKQNLEKELESLSAQPDNKSIKRYQSLKKELEQIIDYEVQGSILRSLCTEYEEGEKCSNYFFNLEKSKAIQKTITWLRGSNGNVITDQKSILEECRLFYKNLYEKSKNTNQNGDSFLNSINIPKLKQKSQDVCDQNLSEQELLKTLKAFEKNKSPGLDGLSAEFYLEFWDLIKNKLLEVYDEAYKRGVLPECLTTGVIVLLEKKGKDRTELANWRPITLLGVDYKLPTKTLAERLKTVLPNLIHPDQNGFVPGGNIFFSTHTIRDILFYCNKEKADLILMALDYTKAFDSVDFGFIHKTFEAFNFGEQFRKLDQSYI